MSSWSTPKMGPEDTLVQITVGQSRAGEGRTASVADPVVPQRLGRMDCRTWPETTAQATQSSGGHEYDDGATSRTRTYYLYCDGDVPLLFTENETNNERLFPQYPNASPYVKDGINNYVVQRDQAAVNPDHQGTKGAAHYQKMVDPGPVSDGASAPHQSGPPRPLRAVVWTRPSPPVCRMRTSSTAL